MGVVAQIAQMGFYIAFRPVEPPAQFYRLGKSASRKVEIDCAA